MMLRFVPILLAGCLSVAAAAQPAQGPAASVPVAPGSVIRQAPAAVAEQAPPKPDQIASVTANEALRRYRELTSALPRCARDAADTDDIVICAPGPKDRFRAWNGDPIPEPVSRRDQRLARRAERSDPLGPDMRCDGAQSTGRCGLPEALRTR